MSKESSKSTSTGASNSTRRTSQPLDNMPKLTTNEFESGFDDITNSVPIVGEAETTKGATANTSTVHFPGSETQQSYIAFKKVLGDDTDTTIQGGGIDEQDEEDRNLTVDTYREQESSVAPMSEAVEEIKYHQKQEMVLTLPASQKSGAKSVDSGARDPIKNSVDVIIRESEQKNAIITNLKVELATCKHHESALQKEVDHLRKENEKLEHQLIDKEEETNRTREDHQNEISILKSQLKGNIDEVTKAKRQLAIAEKQNEEEKQKLEDKIKTLEDHRLELESTVSKLQDDHKKKDLESQELILSLKNQLNDQQALENKRFKELCDTQVKLAQAVAEIAKQEALLKEKDLVLERENKKKLECENQQLKQLHESSQSKLKELEDENTKLKETIERSSSTNLPEFQQQSSETESTASASSLKPSTGKQNSLTESGAPSRTTSAETAGTETETNAHFNLADDNDSTLDLSKLQNTAQDKDTI